MAAEVPISPASTREAAAVTGKGLVRRHPDCPTLSMHRHGSLLPLLGKRRGGAIAPPTCVGGCLLLCFFAVEGPTRCVAVRVCGANQVQASQVFLIK